MKSLPWAAGFGIFLVVAGSAWSSEIRVDSTGGLTSILTDETTDLNFFMDGNPAGLLLLDTHDRLDEAFDWGQQNGQPAGPGSYQQTFGSIPRLADDNDIHYAGCMVFPAPGWAFQAGGDFLSQSGQTPANTFDSLAASRYRGIFRGAANLGLLNLGLEVSDMESDASYGQGLYQNGKYSGIPYTLQTGSSALNQTFIRGGVASAFPENRGPNDAFWQAGGIFEAQVAGGKNAFNASLVYPGGGPFTLRQDNTFSGYYYFGPELRYEVPHRVDLRFNCFLAYGDGDFSQTASQAVSDYVNIPAFRSTQFQSVNAAGAFRLAFPLRSRENVKIGGSVSSYFYNTDDLDPSQNVTGQINRRQINTTLGAGMEAIHDYTLGIQFASQTYFWDNSTVAPAGQGDHDFYQLTFGGERWLDDHFAFRLGLTGEEDQYFQASNLQNLVVLLNTGLGWEDTSWACDLRIWVGEQTDLRDSANQAILDGFGISGTVFL